MQVWRRRGRWERIRCEGYNEKQVSQRGARPSLTKEKPPGGVLVVAEWTKSSRRGKMLWTGHQMSMASDFTTCRVDVTKLASRKGRERSCRRR